MTRRATTIVCIGLVLLAVLAADGRIVFNGFTGWDDPHTIVENPHLNPPSIAGTLHHWTHFAAGLWTPITYTVWAMLAAIGRSAGGAAAGAQTAGGAAGAASLMAWPFHGASLIAHAAASIFVFLILRRLLRRIDDRADFAACAGAMLFAAHPIQVEPVAWASGLKDVLAGALALAAMHQHLVARSAEPRAAELVPGAYRSRRRRHDLIGVACFALAMLSKPSAVVIVPMIAAIDWLIARRPIREIALSLLPWAIVAVPLVIVANRAQETGGIVSLPLQQRALVACDAITFYLWKLLWPMDLVFDYGRTPQVALDSGAAKITWLVPALIAIAIAVARSRAMAAAALLFVLGLSTNLGLARFQFQFYSTVADHYAYLAMLGASLAMAWMMSRAASASRAAGIVAMGGAGAVIALLAAMSFVQAGYWKDSITLFSRAVDLNPDSAGAHNNLGRALAERGGPGDLHAAREQFVQTLKIAPYDPSARRNLALIAIRAGDIDAAIAHLARSIELRERGGEPVPDGDYRELARLRTVQQMKKQTNPPPQPVNPPATPPSAPPAPSPSVPSPSAP